MGLSDEEKNMAGCIMTSLLSLDRVDRHTIKSCFFPQERCKKMAADLRCVSPLGPRFQLSTDSRSHGGDQPLQPPGDDHPMHS